MTEQIQHSRLAPWLIGGVVAVGVGLAAYSAGLHHAAGPSGALHHPHHGFFPFWPFFGFFWIAFVIFLARGFGRHGWRGARGCGYDAAWYDEPSRWDEWHRRAHEHMKNGDDPRR